jgi:hypothetical protein
VLLVDDLVAAGWAVDGPEVGADGSAEVRFSRPFANPEEAAAIFTDIAGPAGPFQDFAVGRSTSFARTEWTFDGRIDASGGLEAFGDADLAAELDGEPLGLTPEEIEKALGDPLEEVIRLRVEARLPGDVTSNGDTEDGVAAWEVPFGDGPVDLAADGTETRWVSLVAGGLAVVCLVALLIHAIIRLVARRRAGRPAEPAHRTEQP